MVFFRIVVSILLLQAAGQSLLLPQTQTGSLQGRVTTTSGAALSKATVSILVLVGSPDAPLDEQVRVQRNATTDPDGKFLLDNVRSGSYRLQVARDGFIGGGISIDLNAGQTLKGLDIVMTPKAAIAGRIVDPSGRPVTRALVQLWKYSYRPESSANRVLANVVSVTTDDLGDYRLFGLAPGTYIISATPTDVMPALNSSPALPSVTASSIARALSTNIGVTVISKPRGDGTVTEESWATVFYPGTTVAAEATPVVVTAGATVGGIDFGTALVPVHRVRGVTVNGNTGLPDSIWLELVPEGSPASGVARYQSSESGAFELAGVASGKYFLMGQNAVMVPIVVGTTDVEGLMVNSRPTLLTINGRIALDDAAPGPGPIRIFPIRLIPLGSPIPITYTSTTANGVFSMRGIWPGDYQMALDGPSTHYLKSVHLGNQDSLDVLHIPSQPEGLLEVVLSSKKGSVDGVIVNERREPVRTATVVMIPEPPLRQRIAMYVQPMIDASGKFHVDAIPGRYKVFAWEAVDAYAWLDSDFLSRYEGLGRSVLITDGSKDSIEVTAIPNNP